MNQELIPFQTWIKALTSPNEETYKEIVNDPGASFGKAALWITAAGLIGGFLQGVIRFIVGPTQTQAFAELFPEAGAIEAGPPTVGSIFASTFGGGVGGILGMLIGIGLIYLVAKSLGGVGTYEKLLYGYTAFQVPISLVSLPLSAIPFGGILSFFIGLYGVVLGVIANKAAMEYDWGKAIISSVVVPLVLGACVVFCLMTILAPAIAGVYGNLGN